MNRKERRALRRNPAARAMVARRREHQAQRLIEARRRAGLGPEAWEALDPEARDYIVRLEQRLGR